MLIYKTLNRKSINALKEGAIGVIPTDTIYGILGSALIPETVKRIYRVKKRNLNKPMIILISGISDLRFFNVRVDGATMKLLDRLWPGKNSVILKSDSKKFHYLHRGKNALAFRLPKDTTLRSFISKTGPLVAPSANPEGLPPAKNIKEARKYFGEKVDFCIDKGNLKSKPSKLVAIENGKIITIRK